MCGLCGVLSIRFRISSRLLSSSDLVSDMIFSALPCFKRFPGEAAIIGRLLAGYGELEFELAQLLGVVMGDVIRAMRVMYRVKTEGNRLDVADAMIFPALPNDELRGQYANAYGAMVHCKSIRNGYAHSHWSANDHNLGRTNLEDFARRSDSNLVHVTYVTLDFLEAQEKYFVFVSECWDYLTSETRLKLHGGPEHKLRFPKILPQPILESREK